MPRLNKLKDLGAVFLLLFILSIPLWMGIGKYQLCKHYFSEMNTVACFFTRLPGVLKQ